ncbi:MAG: HEAT repeat domain-containing protein [Candidatus Cloacimonetes bacterium]|nr:HEAT repeat domain-containing protein [Candidatus Cloacimonadota bacterium]
MRRLIFLLSLIIIFIFNPLFGKKQILDVEPYPYKWQFQQDTKPIKTEIIGNPFDYAGKRIGIDVRNFELPKAYENSYRLACRFPLIDYISNQPLYMKQWAEEVSDTFLIIQKQRRIEVTGYALELLRDTETFPSMKISHDVDLFKDFKDMLFFRSFTSEYRMAVLNLVENFLIAKSMITKAKEDLTNEDLKFFNDNPGYFLIPDGEHMPSLTGDNSTQLDFIKHARNVKFQYIFFAAKIMSEAIYRYWDTVKNMEVSDIYSKPAAYEEPFIYVTNSLRIVIRGIGNDVYTKDADLLIDVGGNDVYQNNAGGCRSSFEEIAVCIDHTGNDLYQAGEDLYVQGFGFLGCGFLVDFQGNDIYEAKHFSQGVGVCGIGVLWDVEGFDSYDAHGICQGAGIVGLGMLLDDAGEDLYDCSTIGQGSATTLGLGILSDLEGDDRYYLAIDESKDKLGYLPGYGQGGALSFRNYPWKKKLTAYGGAGLLLDASGNDRYWTKGWSDQGGSYIMSLGALVDIQGNDHYTANTGQGSGIHITNAILIDKDGHDIYEGGFRTGGSGGDRSPGFLLDYAGNDVYRSHTSSYGTGVKPSSYSLFIDYLGDDTYICDNPKDKITFNNWQSFGGVWPESDPNNWPYALCFDLEGIDDYQVLYHENNCERSSFGHGIFIDMEWSGGDVIGHVDNTLKEQLLPQIPDDVIQSEYNENIRGLLSPSTFMRFQTIGKLISDSIKVIPLLAEILNISENRSLNRDILEIIHYKLVENEINEAIEQSLINCLSSPDDEVRYIIADDIGMWNIACGEEALIQCAQTDTSADVRFAAVQSLMRFKSKKALPFVRRLSEKDHSADVRRIAVKYLGIIDDGIDPFPLLKYALEHDSSPAVRVEAARSLGKRNDERAVPLLEKAAQSFDAYLQRAAGKSLADMGYIEGIEILIESLSFPSIDAFENYNYNIPNFIAMYTGNDFSEQVRYDLHTWKDWFDKNKDSINIEVNIDIMEKYNLLIDSLSSFEQVSKIQPLDNFVNKYPHLMKAKKDLASILNNVAWDLVTAPTGTRRYDLEKGLEYALRCVELDPQLNYIDTLAEAYLQSGLYQQALDICNDVLKDHPENSMFIDRKSVCESFLNK